MNRLASACTTLRVSIRARLGIVLLSATLLLSGCATPPVSEQSIRIEENSPPTVSGRFGLKASFLAEPAQGRFEWRWRGDQDHEVLVQDPWGQVQGVFRRSSAVPGPWAGWSFTDGRGRELAPDADRNGRNAAPFGPETLTALAEMLDTLGQRLRPDTNGVPRDSTDPIAAFHLRRAQSGHWIELRVVRDTQEMPSCRQPAPC